MNKKVDSWSKLQSQIQQSFNINELKNICFALHIDYEELGENLPKSSYVRELLLYVKRQGLVERLLLIIKEERPSVEWPLHLPEWIPVKKSIYQAPSQMGQFIGRETLLKEIEEDLLSGSKHIVVFGLGGCGKTTLAIEITSKVSDLYPDGVLWADLRNAENKSFQEKQNIIASFQNSFAFAFNVDISHIQTIDAKSSNLRDLFVRKRALIVIDNAVTDEDIRPFLPPDDSDCVVIVTSRNRNVLAGKAHHFRVGAFSEQESLKLFETILEKKVVDTTHARRLIQSVGGLPLAINIVAHSIKVYPTQSLQDFYEFLEETDERLDELDEMAGTSKGVRATFEFSYRHLSVKDQEVFSSLSIFSGLDFSIQAAAAITNLSIPKIRRKISRLQSISLIQKSSGQVSIDDSLNERSDLLERYTFHPLVKLFAQEKLNGKYPLLLQRQFDYFLRYVRENYKNYLVVSLDWENLKASLNWARENKLWTDYLEEISLLTSISLGVFGFLDAQGYWQDALELLEPLLLESIKKDSLQEAEIRLKFACFNFRLSNSEEGNKHIEHSLNALQLLSDNDNEKIALYRAYCFELLAQYGNLSPSEGVDLSTKGIQELQRINSQKSIFEEGYLKIRHATLLGKIGQLDEAIALTKEGAKLLPPEPTTARISAYTTLGTACFYSGKLEDALAYWQEGISDAQSLADKRQLSNLINNVGLIASHNGHYIQAKEQYEKALEIAREINYIEREATLLINLTLDAIIMSQHQQAIDHSEATFSIIERFNLPHHKIQALLNRAHLKIRFDDLETVKNDLRLAKELCEQLEDNISIVEVFRVSAQLAYKNQEYEKGLLNIEEALNRVNDPTEDGRCLRIQGELLHALERHEEANRAFAESEKILLEQEIYELANTQLNWGIFKLAMSDQENGQLLLTKALAIYNQIDLIEEVNHCRELLASLL